MFNRMALTLLQKFPPEAAHGAAIWALKTGLAARPSVKPLPALAQKLWGMDFANPLGVAAGFDKNAEVPVPLLRLGFGFTEVGTVTPKPQAGNARPRLFRLPADQAVINRMGFNNHGHSRILQRLKSVQPHRARLGPVGINIGANKDSEDRIVDYVAGVHCFADIADYLVINISSPNTPGLRGLQAPEQLTALLEAVSAAMNGRTQPPLLVKLAPDLDDTALADIAAILPRYPIAGAIVSNTTTGLRAQLRDPAARESGGLSGQPLFDLATDRLRMLYRATAAHRKQHQEFAFIGVGGISDAQQAYEKILAGASLLQIYTSFSYAGPELVSSLLSGLHTRLIADGFTHISEAIGQQA